MTLRTPEYERYHQKIVELLVAETGENYRHWWDIGCDYTQEFADGETPEIVAQCQIDAMKAME